MEGEGGKLSGCKRIATKNKEKKRKRRGECVLGSASN